MLNPYQPPASTGPTKAGDYALLKRILAVPLAGISLLSALLILLSVFGLAWLAFEEGYGEPKWGLLFYFGFLGSACLGSFALARAFWNPARYSRKALDQAELRAIYARERLAERLAETFNGETGIYRETGDGELGRLYARVRADRLPERHRELLARIKQRVEELGPAG
ncbi:MAG: hypothetical protein ACI9VR_000462 [Cognaticolwellia sp.]|jgi:hypothetical protein